MSTHSFWIIQFSYQNNNNKIKSHTNYLFNFSAILTQLKEVIYSHHSKVAWNAGFTKKMLISACQKQTFVWNPRNPQAKFDFLYK